MRTMVRELLAFTIAGIAAVAFVEVADRYLERRADRRRDEHPSRGRYE